MTRLYSLLGGALVPVKRGKLANESMIEGWIASQPDLLGLDLLIIGRQVVTEFGGRIDLLGIDPDGNLVITNSSGTAPRVRSLPKCSTTQAGYQDFRRGRSTSWRSTT